MSNIVYIRHSATPRQTGIGTEGVEVEHRDSSHLALEPKIATPPPSATPPPERLIASPLPPTQAYLAKPQTPKAALNDRDVTDVPGLAIDLEEDPERFELLYVDPNDRWEMKWEVWQQMDEIPGIQRVTLERDGQRAWVHVLVDRDKMSHQAALDELLKGDKRRRSADFEIEVIEVQDAMLH